VDPAKLKPGSPVVAVPKSRVGLYVGIIAAAALAFAAIAVVLDARMQRIKEHDLEQQEALAHHLAEVRTKDAGQIAKAAEQARKDALAAAAAQKKTPDKPGPPVSGQPETAKTAKLPGTLIIDTEPPGASVSVDGATPLTTPARMEGIAAGAHRVRIALTGYQFVELDAQVKGASTTDLGTIKLESSLGTLDITSSPDALEFAVRPGTDPLGKPVWTGRTPATLSGVPRGDYAVTFSRPGFHDHVEKVSVEKEATFLVSTRYLNGSLELTSDPTGAWVDRDGAHLGTTPLVLHDLAPRPVSFEITLPGYDPMPISGEVPEGQTLKLNARLLRKDRVFTPGEAKSLPVSYEAPPPELSLSERRMDAEVTVSLVVQRDGTVVDVQVERTTDDDIGRRCAAAVAKWKFRPGTAPDDRAVDVRIEMPFKFSAGN
jgi:TonB family protein